MYNSQNNIYSMKEKNYVYIIYIRAPSNKEKNYDIYQKIGEISKYIYIYKQLTSYNNITYFNNSIVIMREGKFELRMFLLETLISVN